MPSAKLVAAAVVLLLLVAVAYIYFFVVSPSFVGKPAVEKPALAAAPAAGNVVWVVNELGAFKLHADPLTGHPAVMEIVITDLGLTFTSTTTNNVPVITQGPAADPDLRLKIASADFARLYGASDPAAEAAALYNEGKAQVELLKDATTLASKGYKALYDEMGM
jgi:hypothetical protein